VTTDGEKIVGSSPMHVPADASGLPSFANSSLLDGHLARRHVARGASALFLFSCSHLNYIDRVTRFFRGKRRMTPTWLQRASLYAWCRRRSTAATCCFEIPGA